MGRGNGHTHQVNKAKICGWKGSPCLNSLRDNQPTVSVGLHTPAKDLDADDRRRLNPSITSIVSKNAGGSHALVQELRRLLSPAVAP